MGTCIEVKKKKKLLSLLKIDEPKYHIIHLIDFHLLNYDKISHSTFV